MFNKYIPYYEIYDLKPTEYGDLNIEELGLPNKIEKFLVENNINNVQRLLSLSRLDLMSKYGAEMRVASIIEQQIKKLSRKSHKKDDSSSFNEGILEINGGNASLTNCDEEMETKLSDRDYENLCKELVREGSDDQYAGINDKNFSDEPDDPIDAEIDGVYSIPIKEIVKIDDISEVPIDEIGFDEDLLQRFHDGEIRTIRKMGLFSINELNDYFSINSSEFSRICDAIDLYRESIKKTVRQYWEEEPIAVSNEILTRKKMIAEDFGVSPEKYDNYGIQDAEISNRLKNILKSNNINTIGDLLRRSMSELRVLSGFAATSEREIKYLLTNIREKAVVTPKDDLIDNSEIEAPIASVEKKSDEAYGGVAVVDEMMQTESDTNTGNSEVYEDNSAMSLMIEKDDMEDGFDAIMQDDFEAYQLLNSDNKLEIGQIYSISEDYYDYTIKDLPIDNRLKHLLLRNKITTLGELLTKTFDEISNCRGLGSGTIEEIKDVLTRITMDEDSYFDRALTDYERNDDVEEKESFSDETTIEESKEYEENTPLYLIFGLNPEEFESVPLRSVEIPNRAKNRFFRSDINTIADLLKLTPHHLMSLNSFGKRTFDEVMEFVSKLKDQDISSLMASEEDHLGSEQLENKESVQEPFYVAYNIKPEQYRFNSIHDYSFSNRLGNRLVRLNIKTIEDLLKFSMADMLKVGGFGKTCQSELKDFLMSLSGVVHEERTLLYGELPAKHFIRAYTDDESIRDRLSVYIDNKDISLQECISKMVEKKYEEMYLGKFIDWCYFNIDEDIAKIIRAVKDNPKWEKIARLRAQKMTLEMVGNDLGVTRERVRQIEKKVQNNFDKWAKTTRILWKIYAIRGGDTVLTSTELCEYFGDDSDYIIYLLKNSIAGKQYYDRNTDSFVMGDYSMTERVQEYLDTIPETLPVVEREKYILTGVEEYDLPRELLERTFDEYYNRTGEVFHRYRLVLRKIYLDVLDKYYPNGMHIYDPKELNDFRNKVKNDYGISMEDKSDRSIIGILSANGILCGRGRYKLNKGSTISKDLAKRIKEYVDNNELPIILIGAIYDAFEEELLDEGIDNRYYLQGILHELFADCWYFKRDYIAKDPTFTSVYASVVNFIKHSKYPVSKEEIFSAFPGLTDIVLQLSVSDPNVINLFGTYIHSDRISLSENDVKYLKSVLDKEFCNKDLLHGKDIYPIVMAENPTVLTNNFISFPFGMFSLLEYLFRDEYVFSRPFISREEIQFDRARDVIDGMIADNDTVSISEIQRMAKEYHYTIYSLLDFLDSCNATSLLVNAEEIMQIEKIGVNEFVAKQIEEMILSEVTETVPIANLRCITKFPSINIQWSEWLIYSVIRKWGTVLEVAASSEQFRYSFPVVAPKGKMDLAKIKGIDKEDVGNIAVIDNLDNIDDLIGDYILGEDDLL